MSLGRRWYLVAYDRDRQDWRSFRVDRIADAVATGQRFRPRELPADDALSFVQAGFKQIPQRYAVRVASRSRPTWSRVSSGAGRRWSRTATRRA